MSFSGIYLALFILIFYSFLSYGDSIPNEINMFTTFNNTRNVIKDGSVDTLYAENLSLINETEHNSDKLMRIVTRSGIKNGIDWDEEDEIEDVEDEQLEYKDSSDSNSNEHELDEHSTKATHIYSSENNLEEEPFSVTSQSFSNRKTFSCPQIKTVLVTGTSAADLTPEDIGIIAAMGDSLATGLGLWLSLQPDIEFRGGAFPIGGDANIDGLMTIPNILREFNDQLIGASHGMGTRLQLPLHQLNVAQSNATLSALPEQANELIRRMKMFREVDIIEKWTMVIITIGTDEVCSQCSSPNFNALYDALKFLRKGIKKAFVVLVGPLHVSPSSNQNSNLIIERCLCYQGKNNDYLSELNNSWTTIFNAIEEFFAVTEKNENFGLVALPMLTITSRNPKSLFLTNRPLLNRKGHTYATKWLWNRLIIGPTYNLSSAVLSQDAYYCPPLSCPFFRSRANLVDCAFKGEHLNFKNEHRTVSNGNGPHLPRKYPYLTTLSVVLMCFISVIIFGHIVYRLNPHGSRDRFKPLSFFQKKRAKSHDRERSLDNNEILTLL